MFIMGSLVYVHLVRGGRGKNSRNSNFSFYSFGDQNA